MRVGVQKCPFNAVGVSAISKPVAVDIAVSVRHVVMWDVEMYIALVIHIKLVSIKHPAADL